MEVSVKHEQKYQQFTIAFDGEEDEAELAYALTDDGVLDFTHTYVPEAYRGKGLVNKLMTEGMRFARENNYTVTASCPAAASFLKRRK